MKKLVFTTINTRLSYLLACLQAATSIVLVLGVLEPVYGDDFSCASGDVTCLIAAINNANGMPGEHLITLDPGIYALQIVDNTTDGPNGLPSIRRSILIQASGDDPPTVIERDPAAEGFRIFHVSASGDLGLEGLTVQRGGGSLSFPFSGHAIFNLGVTSLRDSIVTDSIGEAGAIFNSGTLNVFKSIITDNSSGHRGGGIVNGLPPFVAGGNVLIEDSTIAHNISDGPGGISNNGALVVRNSSIIFNDAVGTGSGGGIFNTGVAEIVNSTIAENVAEGFFGGGGGGIANFGQLSVTNSTIRNNKGFRSPAGIWNSGGTLKVQNTIVAGNTVEDPPFAPVNASDCAGTITSLGNNLFGDPTRCNPQPTDLSGGRWYNAQKGSAVP